MKLKTYLAETEQTHADLASKLGITRQAVTRMIKRGAIVIDNKIYSPQYEIKND